MIIYGFGHPAVSEEGAVFSVLLTTRVFIHFRFDDHRNNIYVSRPIQTRYIDFLVFVIPSFSPRSSQPSFPPPAHPLGQRHKTYALVSSAATHRLRGSLLYTPTHIRSDSRFPVIIIIIIIYRSKNSSISMRLVE